MKYDLLEPLSDLNASLDLLTNVFAPIYTDSWIQDKAQFYGNAQFDINIGAFTQMWFSKIMRIFMAYDDSGKTVGYMLGITLRPLTHRRSIFQIEDWYAKDRNQEVIDGLFDYMQTALKFIGADELWISHNERIMPPAIGNGWHRRGAFIIDRYVK